jgi:hypothetical protein
MPERRRVTPEYIREMAAIHGVPLDPETVERRVRDIELNLSRLDGVPLEELHDVPPAYLGPISVPKARAK